MQKNQKLKNLKSSFYKLKLIAGHHCSAIFMGRNDYICRLFF